MIIKKKLKCSSQSSSKLIVIYCRANELAVTNLYGYKRKKKMFEYIMQSILVQNDIDYLSKTKSYPMRDCD